MIGSPRQPYIVDVYHQPPGYSQPVLKEQHRIMARSDADSISEPQAIFAGRDAPMVTGFALRSVGSRRFGDQTVYRHELPTRWRSTTARIEANPLMRVNQGENAYCLTGECYPRSGRCLIEMLPLPHALGTKVPTPLHS
jgi:hypothetical protein